MKKLFLLVILFTAGFCAFAGKIYKSSATASYYGEAYHGKPTSSGETFNMKDYTCAHKSLPFDTILRVTNLSNGKVVKVRVNDRGPFVVGREIDLSTAAAAKLDMLGTGTAKVKIEILKMGPETELSKQTAAKAKEIMAKKEGNTNSSSSSKKKSSGSNSSKKKTTDSKKTENEETAVKAKNEETPVLWDIQVGAFKSKENARKRAKALSDAGFTKIVIQKTGEIYRVAIKEVESNEVAELEGKLQENGFSEYSVRRRKTQP